MKNILVSPLTIIASFIALVEYILGKTAVVIEPLGLRVFIVISMVLILAIVLVLFFLVLIKYPTHFYPPKAFPKGAESYCSGQSPSKKQEIWVESAVSKEEKK